MNLWGDVNELLKWGLPCFQKAWVAWLGPDGVSQNLWVICLLSSLFRLSVATVSVSLGGEVTRWQNACC